MQRKFKAHKLAEANPTQAKTQTAKAGKAAKNSDEPEIIEQAPGSKTPDDPTRFGDWSVGGRCVDF